MEEAIKIRDEVSPLFNNILNHLGEYDKYAIMYTHSWEQGEAHNILALPKDERFDKLEFVGVVVDMIRDYADNTDWDLTSSPEFDALIGVLKKIQKGEY